MAVQLDSCPSCGTTVESVEVYKCSECGTMQCSICSNNIGMSQYEHKCKSCGKKLSGWEIYGFTKVKD